MNTNDLPPAARLAALIEAGRAANPDVKHGVGAFLQKGRACAIGYAALAAGALRREIDYDTSKNVVEGAKPLTDALGMVREDLLPFSGNRLLVQVQRLNDAGRWSLDDIILSLREGELAKVTA